MRQTIKDIINEYDELHFATITKPDKFDKSSWIIEVNDNTSKLCGINEPISNYQFQIVTLRRNNHFFISYKIFFDNTFEYFVDCKKSLHRSSVNKYMDELIKYVIYSNDISTTKNSPSIKVSKQIMLNNGIDNFVELCAYYGDYSAIGTGITRNIRNLVVMDIDVDCTKTENKIETEKLLFKFSQCNSLPDFLIFNHETNHIQLQWLVQDFKYKEIDYDIIENIRTDLINDDIKNKEIKLLGTSFTKLSRNGEEYRKFTLSLTDIVNKKKFGDKNYTFWKAKNFFTAYLGKYNLELKMPYIKNGKVDFLSTEDVKYLLGTKESRKLYFEEAPTITELYKKMNPIVGNIIKKHIKSYTKKIKEIKDDDDITDIDNNEKIFGTSRNNFVLKCTRETTWEISRKKNLKTSKDINSLTQIEFDKLKRSVKRSVKSKYKKEDLKYKGIWPDTTNHSPYSNEEFNSTFEYSFIFAIQNMSNDYWDNEQRQSSINQRHLKKEMHLIIVDYVRNKNIKIKRNELLFQVNKILENSGHKKISLTSLKRYIYESKNMTDENRKNIYSYFASNIEERKSILNEAKEKYSNNKKAINIYQKRYDYINLNIINEII